MSTFRCIFKDTSGGKLIIGSYPKPELIFSMDIDLCLNLCTATEKLSMQNYREVYQREVGNRSRCIFIDLEVDTNLNYIDRQWHHMIGVLRDAVMSGKSCYVHDLACGDRVKVFSACVMLVYDDYSTIHNTLVKVDNTYKSRPNTRLISIVTKARHEMRTSKL